MARQPVIPPQYLPPGPPVPGPITGKQLLYRDLMKTIYADYRLIREILQRHHAQFAELLRSPFAREYYYNYGVDFMQEFVDNPEGFPDENLNYLVDMLYENYGLSEQFTVDDPDGKELFLLNNQLLTNIFRDMAEVGYEFHYFAFFRSADPRVIAFWGGIKPTPQNFEIGTMLLAPESYGDILRMISNEPGYYGVNSFTRRTDLLRTYDGPEPSPHGYGQNMVGWRKYDLAQAIKATGLNTPKVVQDPRSDDLNRLTKEGFPRNKWTIIDLLNKGITKGGRRTSDLAEMFGYTDRSPRGTMPGFKTTPYMPKLYYEAIYRKLFNTMINIDWVQVCRQKLVYYPKLRQIAVSDFGFRYNDVKQLDYDQICDLLEQESKRRRAIQEELMAGVPEAQQVVALQPGGRIMRQVQAEAVKLRPGAFAPIAEPEREVKPQLQRLIAMCADPNVTREQIFDLAQEMDLEILFARLPQAAPTKEDYCGVLKNYLERTQARSPQ